MAYALPSAAHAPGTATKEESYNQLFVSAVYVQKLRTVPQKNAEADYWRSVIVSYAGRFGVPADIMVRIAECESKIRMVWNYRHEENPDYFTAFGIFQTVAGHEKTYNLSRLTPEGNIEIAMRLYLDEGTAPWNSSRSCWE